MSNSPRNFASTASAPAADDFMILDGATNNTRKLSAGHLAAIRNALAPAQGLVFAGTTGATAANAAAFGSGDFTVSVLVTPTSFAAARYIFGGAADSFALFIHTDGTLIVKKQGGSNLTASTSALVAGKATLIKYVRGTTTGTYYINGVAAGTAVDANNYTVASTLFGATLTLTTTPMLGTMGPIYALNRALTAAEVLSLYERAAPAAVDYPSRPAGSTATIACLVGTWSGSVAGSTFTVNTASTGFISGQVVVQGGNMPTGRVRVNYDLTINSGLGPAFGDGNNYSTARLVSGSNQSIEFTGPTAGTNLSLVNGFSAGNYVVTINSVTVLGLLIAPAVQAPGNGFQWRDQSGNLADITRPVLNVLWALPATLPQTLRFRTSTNGNQQILGQQALPANARITSWVVNRDATAATISLGNASGGAQFVSALVLGAGLNDIALLTRFCSTNNLWVNSNSTAVLMHTISYEIAN